MTGRERERPYIPKHVRGYGSKKQELLRIITRHLFPRYDADRKRFEKRQNRNSLNSTARTCGHKVSICFAARRTIFTPSSLLDMEQAKFATSTSLPACSRNTCRNQTERLFGSFRPHIPSDNFSAWPYNKMSRRKNFFQTKIIYSTNKAYTSWNFAKFAVQRFFKQPNNSVG